MKTAKKRRGLSENRLLSDARSPGERSSRLRLVRLNDEGKARFSIGFEDDAPGARRHLGQWWRLMLRYRPAGGPADADFARSRQLFLADTHRDTGGALCAIEAGDFEAVLETALQLKREGVIYGFPKISAMGDAMARAILHEDVRGVRAIAQFVMTYLCEAMNRLPAYESPKLT